MIIISDASLLFDDLQGENFITVEYNPITHSFIIECNGQVTETSLQQYDYLVDQGFIYADL